MDTTFRDKILTCTECGNEFVYTVGQQRMAYEESGEIEEPVLCPVCEVKIERMGRREESSNGHQPRDESMSNGGQPVPYLNGSSHQHTPPAVAESWNEEGWEDEEAEAEQPEASNEGDDASKSSSSYRSGEAHPLFGHHGESYTGHVKWFNDRKGFGFIVLDNGIEIFVHYSGIVGEGYKTLKEEQRVRITVEDTAKGPQASEVTPLDEGPVETSEPAEASPVSEPQEEFAEQS